jgi:hypothetical protein
LELFLEWMNDWGLSKKSLTKIFGRKKSQSTYIMQCNVVVKVPKATSNIGQAQIKSPTDPKDKTNIWFVVTDF